MARPLLLCLLASVLPGTSCLLAGASMRTRVPTASRPLQLRAARRSPDPRASLIPDVAASASSAIAAADAASLLLAEASSSAAPDFGEVFMAGMTIAFAGVGATIFVGFLVRGKYDEVEQSFFDAQDEEVARDGVRAAADSKSQTAKDFFGDSTPSAAPPAPARSAEETSA